LKKNHTPSPSATNSDSFHCDIDFEALILKADQLIKDVPPSDLLLLADPLISRVIEENK
jgi:hypothetical protein